MQGTSQILVTFYIFNRGGRQTGGYFILQYSTYTYYRLHCTYNMAHDFQKIIFPNEKMGKVLVKFSNENVKPLMTEMCALLDSNAQNRMFHEADPEQMLV